MSRLEHVLRVGVQLKRTEEPPLVEDAEYEKDVADIPPEWYRFDVVNAEKINKQTRDTWVRMKRAEREALQKREMEYADGLNRGDEQWFKDLEDVPPRYYGMSDEDKWEKQMLWEEDWVRHKRALRKHQEMKGPAPGPFIQYADGRGENWVYDKGLDKYRWVEYDPADTSTYAWNGYELDEPPLVEDAEYREDVADFPQMYMALDGDGPRRNKESRDAWVRRKRAEREAMQKRQMEEPDVLVRDEQFFKDLEDMPGPFFAISDDNKAETLNKAQEYWVRRKRALRNAAAPPPRYQSLG